MESTLLKFSNDEKIEYYYQSLEIDSLDSYKKKLSTLDLPIFMTKNGQNGNQIKALSESKLEAAQAE